MSKRESGWYRVCGENFSWELLKFDAESGLFRVDDDWMDEELLLKLGVVIYPQMVMTLSGELVYQSNLEGAEISLDVSTCDSDAGNRIFGVVNGFSESNGKLVTLAEETSRNFGVNEHNPLYNTSQEG